MRKVTWRKHHKWFGLILCFFLVMFCVSGIILNHRSAVAGIDIGRNLLPSAYRLKNWNGGLIRGSLKYVGIEGDSVQLVSGNNGIWRIDSGTQEVTDFNAGMPRGADRRNIRALLQLPDRSLLAAGSFGLYHYKDERWSDIPIDLAGDERLTDLLLKQDTVVLAGRSFLYVWPWREIDKMERKQLSPAADHDGKVSLFRTVWALHSGEMFGMGGRILVDTVALILIFLSLTGVLLWFLPGSMKRLRQKGCAVKKQATVFKQSFYLHDQIGRYALVLLLFVSITGLALRPPLLIVLAGRQVPAIPGSHFDSDNPWRDKLRMVRYDEANDDWLVSASDGFYALKTLDSTPVRIADAPPVSVMGLNVWHRSSSDEWLVGSFSGMYLWNRFTHSISDYSSLPIHSVSGLVADYNGRDYVVEYGKGSDFIEMPEQMEVLGMSLWNVALEVHTGRIYTLLGKWTMLFPFFAGIAIVWCLWSGYVIRKRKQ